MSTHDPRIWIAVAAVLAGMGTQLLTLVAIAAAGAICARVRSLVSPRAAQRARARVALAAYRKDHVSYGRKR